MKIIHDRVIGIASDREEPQPFKGRGSWSRELCRSLVAYRLGYTPRSLLTHAPNSSLLAMRGLFRQLLRDFIERKLGVDLRDKLW